MKGKDASRFWSKVGVAGEDECWPWNGYRHPRGYGYIGMGGGWLKAHAVSADLCGLGPTKGLCVCHKCDNPWCVNPAHLFVATQRENIADMDAKGRRGSTPGDKNAAAKLTKDDVRAIRLDKESTTKQLAVRFGVTAGHVRKIVRGDLWKLTFLY